MVNIKAITIGNQKQADILYWVIFILTVFIIGWFLIENIKNSQESHIDRPVTSKNSLPPNERKSIEESLSLYKEQEKPLVQSERSNIKQSLEKTISPLSEDERKQIEQAIKNYR